MTHTYYHHLNIQRATQVRWKNFKLNLHHYLANYCSHITMSNVIYNKWLLVPLTEPFEEIFHIQRTASTFVFK